MVGEVFFCCCCFNVLTSHNKMLVALHQSIDLVCLWWRVVLIFEIKIWLLLS